jgi:protein TonB
VRLTVEVLASGRVGGVWVKGSSGHEILDQSALKAVTEWRFIPARFVGIPVKSTVIVPITFTLRNN